MKLLEKYLNGHSEQERLLILDEFVKEKKFIPLGFLKDYFCLRLSTIEKAKLIERCYSADNLALETFLISGLTEWHQDIAAQAILKWANSTHHLLWYRLIPILNSPHLPQRVQYTIINCCLEYSLDQLLEAATLRPQLEEMSDAFHALIFEKALQHSVENPKLSDLSEKTIEYGIKENWPHSKSLVAALHYIARADSKVIEKCIEEKNLALSTESFFSAISNVKVISAKKIGNITGNIKWPSLVARKKIAKATVEKAIRYFFDEDRQKDFDTHDVRSAFSGIPGKLLQTAIEKNIKTVNDLASSQKLSTFINSNCETFKDVMQSMVANGINPVEILEILDSRTRLLLANELGQKNQDIEVIKEEEKNTLNDVITEQTYEYFEETISRFPISVDGELAKDSQESAREIFFKFFYKKVKPKRVFSKEESKGFWAILLKANEKQDAQQIDDLAIAARKEPRMHQLPYIDTLATYKDSDKAALKTFDYCREDDPVFVETAVHALSGIATPRAVQELIHTLTRPNISDQLRLDITTLLKNHDLKNLQTELRATVNDLVVEVDKESLIWEVRESLLQYVKSEIPEDIEKEAKQKILDRPLGQDIKVSSNEENPLDGLLVRKIPHYRNLSSEVRRALRTAQFFHFHTQNADHSISIDLSPAIDMQYKALELLFREQFENYCFQLISNGILQRKLDVIGYARPIVPKMDSFEAYISQFPIISDIPFFSKFKLRKMLRGICQYRPGKRFTLDGIKAFSLFFLTFGRSNCKYGLANISSLGFKSEEELFEFCKVLHVFQDFRNRATHEGFHPDARNNIDSIWQSTAEIIQNAFKIKDHLDEIAKNDGPRNRRVADAS